MKRLITYTSLILSALLILDSVNAVDALVMFVIAGKVPGTTVYIDAASMLTLLMVPTGFLAGRLTARFVVFLSRPRALRSHA